MEVKSGKDNAIKFQQIYISPEDKYTYIGSKNCVDTAVAYILKTRYYNNEHLLELFLDDISFVYKNKEKKIENLCRYEKVYRLNRIEQLFTEDLPRIALKKIIDKYGEVVIVTSTHALPYKIEYDTDVFNPDSGRHAIAVIGYDEEYVYILEGDNYIGPGYETSDFNPSIGRCRMEYIEACMLKYFQCFDVVFEFDTEIEKCQEYVRNVFKNIVGCKWDENEDEVYGLKAIKCLEMLFRDGSDVYDFYTDVNIMELSNIAKSREVMKHFVINKTDDLTNIKTVFDDSIRLWTKLIRLIMRRKANSRERVYDNTEVCKILVCLYDVENQIYSCINDIYHEQL